MHPERLPDCRPPRRQAGITFASAHPELICGDFAMRPRIPVSLNAEDRAAVQLWSHRMILAMLLLFILGVGLVPMLGNGPRAMMADDTPAEIATR